LACLRTQLFAIVDDSLTSKNLSQLMLSPDNLLRLEIKSMRVVIVAWKFAETVVGGALSVASIVFNAEVAIFMEAARWTQHFCAALVNIFCLRESNLGLSNGDVSRLLEPLRVS
jgi:hypothetical protein